MYQSRPTHSHSGDHVSRRPLLVQASYMMDSSKVCMIGGVPWRHPTPFFNLSPIARHLNASTLSLGLSPRNSAMGLSTACHSQLQD